MSNDKIVAPPTVTCSMCGKLHPRHFAFAIQNTSFICPQCLPSYQVMYPQYFQEAASPYVSQFEEPRLSYAYRKGDVLIVNKNAALPDRCVKCNSDEVAVRKTARLSWTPPATYWAFFAGIPILLILILVLQRRAEVSIGLCEKHQKQHRIHQAIAYVLWVLVISLFFVAVIKNSGLTFLFGFILFIGALIHKLAVLPVLRAKKIDGDSVWIKGVSRDLLDAIVPPE